MRDRYVELALPYIPRLLHLVDQNPYSRTYGCLDRAFWHYRTMDFPCGMSQEMVLPLALVYANEYPGNRYHGVQRMREIAEAAVRYMAKSSHADGTCDDYFPSSGPWARWSSASTQPARPTRSSGWRTTRSSTCSSAASTTSRPKTRPDA